MDRHVTASCGLGVQLIVRSANHEPRKRGSVGVVVHPFQARGLAVAKSFGRKYVEFATPTSPVKLALYGRRALAKDAGVSPDGTGSHRLTIGGDAGPFTDPDGFAWE